MRAWQVQDEWGIDHLRQVDLPVPRPGPGQVVVRMKAASLNYRDLLTVQGKGGTRKLPLVPFSDGAGEVGAVGEGVTRVAIGDRVCPLFFQTWFEGGPSAEKRARPLGGPLPGVLQDEMLVSAEGVSKVPSHLSYEEAATLPCAGLTAWRALMVEGNLRPGQTVLVQGTGGVSIFALQFAKLAGARVIVTSSSDEKLARARALGADLTINYKATPEWGKAAVALTGGIGVDHVIEVGGKETLNQSLEAARVGGSIMVIGLLTGAAQQLIIPTLFAKNLRVIGLSVGSRAQFEAMAAAMEVAALKPVIDRVVPFDDVPETLRAMPAGAHFGKICVSF
jgi:NADPH:quinone reductase-like Zn-dependent oxidoreductase